MVAVEGNGQKSPSSKAEAFLTRGAYSQYVSANAVKSGKSVNPKVRHNGENAAGGFFHHSPFMKKCMPIPAAYPRAKTGVHLR